MMSSTISASVRTALAVTKTFTGADAGNPDASFTSGNPSGDTYTSSSSVPVTIESKFTVTLTAGAYTLDLTAIPGDTDAGTLDGTGLKLQFLRLEGSSGNANKIEVKNGAVNGYRTDAATTASLDVVLLAGQKAQFEFDEAADDVSSTHKTLDFAGTGSQTMLVHVVLG